MALRTIREKLIIQRLVFLSSKDRRGAIYSHNPIITKVDRKKPSRSATSLAIIETLQYKLALIDIGLISLQ